MPNKIQPRVPRGMRDILPQKMILRQYVIGEVERVFQRFGFEPLQTPALELRETLLGKYGEDAEKLIYDARHREGKEDLSLRYDLTVPLTRVVAMYPELVKPFKRYQIAPVWRAERPQKGRYREFYQCDADIIGSASMLADAEIIAVIYTILTELGFKQFRIKLNNRKILTAMGDFSGVSPDLLSALYRSIDKYDKIGRDGVREELIKNQVPKAVVQKILGLLTLSTGDLGEWGTLLRSNELAQEGFNELIQVLQFISEMGIAREHIQVDLAMLRGNRIDTERINELIQLILKFNEIGMPVDLTMVRGLEYYTGMIFETVVTEPKIGSLTGGGRYDDLIGLFTGKPLPATGTSFGIERIIDVMEELAMFPPNVGKTVTQVLVTVFDNALIGASIRVANELRAAGLNTELALDTDGLGKQLKYAAAKGIPFAVIVGPDEVSAQKATLRDLASGEQILIAQSELANVIKLKAES